MFYSGRLVRPAPPPVVRASGAPVGVMTDPLEQWMIVLLATLTAAAGLATLADWLHLG